MCTSYFSQDNHAIAHNLCSPLYLDNLAFVFNNRDRKMCCMLTDMVLFELNLFYDTVQGSPRGVGVGGAVVGCFPPITPTCMSDGVLHFTQFYSALFLHIIMPRLASQDLSLMIIKYIIVYRVYS